jgi:hypothetical protein
MTHEQKPGNDIGNTTIGIQDSLTEFLDACVEGNPKAVAKIIMTCTQPLDAVRFGRILEQMEIECQASINESSRFVEAVMLLARLEELDGPMTPGQLKMFDNSTTCTCGAQEQGDHRPHDMTCPLYAPLRH